MGFSRRWHWSSQQVQVSAAAPMPTVFGSSSWHEPASPSHPRHLPQAPIQRSHHDNRGPARQAKQLAQQLLKAFALRIGQRQVGPVVHRELHNLWGSAGWLAGGLEDHCCVSLEWQLEEEGGAPNCMQSGLLPSHPSLPPGPHHQVCIGRHHLLGTGCKDARGGAADALVEQHVGPAADRRA